MSAGDGREIFVAQFQLDGAGVNIGFAQAAADHFGESHQRGFELRRVGGVFVVGVLVADGFGVGIGADLGVEPSTGIFAARFAGEREPPFAEAVCKFGLV